MNPKFQRRVQRYGWDLAAGDYEPLWQTQLAPARDALLRAASLGRGERVLDVACGTGLVAFEAARAVGPEGSVTGVDLSGKMVDAARQRAVDLGLSNVSLGRMDAEQLELPDSSFDVALCSLGLMYVPDPFRALSEMARVLRPGGRLAISVWGSRAHCGWAPVFEIVDAEVASEVCPLFFELGHQDTLSAMLARISLERIRHDRLTTTLDYGDAQEACDAAFIGGPAALSWSHFSGAVRERVRERYVAAIAPWRQGDAYRLPGEFVLAAGAKPLTQP